MPLEEKTIVDIREEMALAAMAAGATVTEVAVQFGVAVPQFDCGVIDIESKAVQGSKIVRTRQEVVHTERIRRSRS